MYFVIVLRHNRGAAVGFIYRILLLGWTRVRELRINYYNTHQICIASQKNSAQTFR